MFALRFGLPAPPYSRSNAVIIETLGRRSGERRRTPVGYLEEDGRIIIVAENGARAHYVRNALARGGQLRVFHRGLWREATLRLLDDDPESYLARMSSAHASLVRRLGSDLRVVEITQQD
jgi:deazaflavin-dependent oxidoreductase (nitroreductase family)